LSLHDAADTHIVIVTHDAADTHIVIVTHDAADTHIVIVTHDAAHTHIVIVTHDAADTLKEGWAALPGSLGLLGFKVPAGLGMACCPQEEAPWPT